MKEEGRKSFDYAQEPKKEESPLRNRRRKKVLRLRSGTEEGRKSFDYAQEPKKEEGIIARISVIKNAFD
ncbi:MAG: hypothetical protein EAZ18_09230 [Oscillatoriales cyanobacterium]|nr:MAG: hypothetical protein EAZ18_09230 [Oscillatoriales cyanobacterium]